MPNLLKRMRKLRTLINVRTGPGAALLPNTSTSTEEHPPITRLHLTYAQKIYGGHQGARHFWRRSLPRLKFYNPAVPMSVRQTQEQEGPAALTVYFADKISKAASKSAAKNVDDMHAPSPAEGEKSAVVDLKNLEHADIWKKVLTVTGAEEVQASEEDAQELKTLEELRVQSEKDRARVATLRQKKKDHERMLADARGEAERLRNLGN